MKYAAQIIAFGIELEEKIRCPICNRNIKWATQVLDDNNELILMGEDCAVKLFSKDEVKEKKKHLKIEKDLDGVLDNLF
jgi:hypothetical protein